MLRVLDYTVPYSVALIIRLIFLRQEQYISKLMKLNHIILHLKLERKSIKVCTKMGAKLKIFN